jgi:hypothetical protein
LDNDASECKAIACRDGPPVLAIGVTVLRDGRLGGLGMFLGRKFVFLKE